VWTEGEFGSILMTEPLLSIINGIPTQYVADQRQYMISFEKDNFFITDSNEKEKEEMLGGQKIGHLREISWTKDTLYCTFRKEFLDVDEWREVTVYCKYVKVSDNPSFGQQY
jgi:hypothetical protein